MADRPDLAELCRAALQAAADGLAVEAYAAETRRTQVKVRGGEVESLSFAETRGVGVRVIAEGRLGYAYAADPSLSEVGRAVQGARENAALATADEYNVLPAARAAAPLPGIFVESQLRVPTERKVELALELERATVRSGGAVRAVEQATYGDSVSRVCLASTSGTAGEYARTDCWCSVSALASDGNETQTGFAFRLGRDTDGLEWLGCAEEAAGRATRLLGARKPPTARLPVVLDPYAAAAFLGVMAGALSAEAVQKGRSLFASLLGEPVASEAVSLVDDGRLLTGPAAAPFDDEGVSTQRTPLIQRGRLARFLHNTYTAARGRALSTGNAGRAGYRSPPGVSPTNFFLEAGKAEQEHLLKQAGEGVYIQDVSGVHSGANPISGEFSVGATGLRISGGALGQPMREMTVASTLPEVLRAVVAVGADLRFLGSIGSASVLVAEMTIAGS